MTPTTLYPERYHGRAFNITFGILTAIAWCLLLGGMTWIAVGLWGTGQ